jgi:hypothetical protein
MLVQMLVTVRGSEHSYDINEEVNIPQDMALDWAARGVCKLLEAPKREVKPELEKADMDETEVEKPQVPTKRGKK